MANGMRNEDKWAALGQQRPQAYRHGAGSSGQAPRSHQLQQPKQPQQPPRSLVEYVRQNATYILSVVAVVVVVVLMIAFLRGCSPEGDEPEGEAPYESPYDWSLLQRDGDRLAYVADGQVKSRLGVDVSENQHEIDWQAVADDGVDFAFVRLGYRGATEGDLYLDGYYWDNIEGARAAGLDCGIYFFSQAISEQEAIEEAEFVLDYLGGTPLEYPIAFDSEVVAGLGITRTKDLSSEQMDAIANAFCDRIEQAGYRSMLYGNAGDLARYDLPSLQEHGIWWAEYDVALPTHYVDISLWQYANGGSVAGIETAVDLNIDLSGALD